MAFIRADMPKDVDGKAIQVLAPVEGTVAEVVIGAASSSVALPSGASVVEVAASDLCRIKFGDASVDASVGTVRVFPAGVAVYRVPVGATHIAAIRIGSSSGFLTVAELV